MKLLRTIALAAVLAMAGCATLFNGTSPWPGRPGVAEHLLRGLRRLGRLLQIRRRQPGREPRHRHLRGPDTDSRRPGSRRRARVPGPDRVRPAISGRTRAGRRGRRAVRPRESTSGRGAGYRTQGAAPADRRGQQVRGPATRGVVSDLVAQEGAHPRPARLDVPCILPGKQVQEDPGGRGPVRTPAAVSLHDRRGQPLDQVGDVRRTPRAPR